MAARSPEPDAAPGVRAGLPAVLEPVADDLAAVGQRYSDILAVHSERVREVVSPSARFGGKRLRPALTCLAARVVAGRASPDVITAAAVVELIHTATLVHDDILDGAVVRRKVATLNARFGDQLAVLGGDVLFSKAYRAAAHLDDPFAARYLSDVVGEILEGEIHQDLVARNPALTHDEYRRIIRGKTAALYEAALVVGAHYAGASRAQRDALGRYGHHLGMAFQIVDDRLDLTGDEGTVGKSLGRDLSEGKTTLPVILWRDGLPEDARAQARTQVETAWESPEAARALAALLERSGALEAADEHARREVAAARESLQGLPAGPARDLLDRLGDYVLVRNW